MSDELPVINDIPWSPIDTMLEAAAVFLLATAWIVTFVQYGRIPQSVPTHFNFSGQADSWGMRETILAIPITATVLYALLTGVCFLSPRRYNYPVKITPENAGAQYALARQLLRAMKVLVTGIFTFLLWGVVQIAIGAKRELGPSFLIVSLACVGLTIATYAVRARRMK